VSQLLDKMQQTVMIRRPKAGLHLPSKWAQLCPSRALARYLAAVSQWSPAWAHDPVKGLWPVFGQLVRTAQGVTMTATPLSVAAAMSHIIHPLLARAGIRDPHTVNAHFGRPTGTNFLTIECGLFGDYPESLGGWAPTTVLSKFYQSLSSAQIAKVCADEVAIRRPGVPLCCRG
jgi:hypothetical protein